MLTRNNLARLGGVIAALSLIFLPLASCGDAQLTGIDIFQAEGGGGHKVVLFIALAAAILSVVIMQRWAQMILGATGIATIVLEYINTLNDPERTVQLLGGAFLALLGFVLVLVAGLMNGRPASTKKRPG